MTECRSCRGYQGITFQLTCIPSRSTEQALYCVYNTLACLFIASEPLFVALIFLIPDKTSNSLFYSFRLVCTVVWVHVRSGNLFFFFFSEAGTEIDGNTNQVL